MGNSLAQLTNDKVTGHQMVLHLWINATDVLIVTEIDTDRNIDFLHNVLFQNFITMSSYTVYEQKQYFARYRFKSQLSLSITILVVAHITPYTNYTSLPSQSL